MKLPTSKLNIRMLAFDLDDTLLTDSCTITPRTVKALRKAAEKGIYIILCSGRAENGILPYIRALDLAGQQEGRFIIAFNGAHVFDLHRRINIYSDVIKSDILKTVYEEALLLDMPSIVYHNESICSWRDDEWARMDAKLCNLDFKLYTKEGFLKLLERGFPKILVPGDCDKVQRLRSTLKETLGNKVDIYISKPFFLEVMNHNIGKGQTLTRLADYLEIPHSAIMAFGDSMNDESMLVQSAQTGFAGHGVAMINGSEQLKLSAEFVTRLDNNNDGIADFLEDFVL